MRQVILLPVALALAGCPSPPIPSCPGQAGCPAENRDMAMENLPDLASSPDGGQGSRGDHVWSQALGGTGSEQAFSVATDRDNNVVVTGTFTGSMSAGGQTITSKGEGDVFLAKYGPDGKLAWLKGFGGTGDDAAYGVATDGSDIVIAGAFVGQSDFGGGALRSFGGYDIVVARYGPDGAHRFSQRHGGSTDDAASSVAVGKDGNIYLTGYITGSAQVGGASLRSAGGLDTFVASLSSAGTARWAKGGGGSGDDFGNRIAADPSGGAVAVGFFNGQASFDDKSLRSTGGGDTLVVRYGEGGEVVWAKGVGGAKDDKANTVAVDGTGEVIIAGSFHDAIDLGGGSMRQNGPNGIYLARYTAAGVYRWGTVFGNNDSSAINMVALDRQGNIVWGGSANGPLDVGGGVLFDGGAIIAKYTAGGQHLWSRVFTGPPTVNQAINGIATDSLGNVVSAGFFVESLIAGGDQLRANGAEDVLVVKYTP